MLEARLRFAAFYKHKQGRVNKKESNTKPKLLLDQEEAGQYLLLMCQFSRCYSPKVMSG